MQYGINLNPRHPVGRPAHINDLRGVKWARIVFKAPAVFETIQQAFAFYDRQIADYERIGMRTLLVLNQETFWGHGPWDHGNYERYAREFAAAIRPIIERYRGRGVAYQIWNEGDIRGHSSIYVPAAEFALVLRDAYNTIKSADPSALVVLGGLASGAGDAVEYVATIRTALGGKLHADAIGIHPYGQWTPNFSGHPSWGGWHGRLQDYMYYVNRGMPRNIPLWITEIGISESVDYTSAQYPMVIKYMEGLDDFFRRYYANRVPVLIWFAWSDVMRQAGIVNRQNQPKVPVYNKFFKLARSSDTELPPATTPTVAYGVLLRPMVRLSVRNGPGTANKRVAMVDQEDLLVALDHPLTVIDKLGEEGAWVQVRTPDNVEGHTAAWYVELEQVVLKTTSAGGLNIRAGAGTNHDIVETVAFDDPLIALEPLEDVTAKIGGQGEWIEIRTPNGNEGYAAAWLLQKLSDAAPPDDDIPEDGDTDAPEPETPDDTVLVSPTVNLNLRRGPALDADRITVMSRGTCLLVVAALDGALDRLGEDGWVKIKMPDGTIGWTAAQYLERIDRADCDDLDAFDLEEETPEPPTLEAVFVATTTRLNMRSAPEVANNLLTVLDEDQCLLVIDDPQKALESLGEAGWIKVREADGTGGWVSAQYLRRINAQDCPDLAKFDVSDDEIADDDDKEGTLDPDTGENVADGFDMPVGSAEERASDDIYPGHWFDPTGFGRDTYRQYVVQRGAYHTGIDLNLNKPRWNADRGMPVYATASGIVTYAARRVPSWGNIVVIKHDPYDGEVYYSRYAHLATMTVQKGERVERGDQIGTIGAHLNKRGQPYTGAEHLHFDIAQTDVLVANPGDWPRLDLDRLERDYVDPKAFIKMHRPRRS